MNVLKRIWMCALLLLFTAALHATHIVGGEITYKYEGKNGSGQDYYTVRLDLYIDCKNGNPQAISQDATAFLGVFDSKTGTILSGYPVEVPRKGPERIVKLNYNCIRTIPSACVDHYWYTTTMVLPPRTGGYVISFQRCCRNNSITNLWSPGSTGANYWTTIPDSRTLPDKKPNSSAVFKELPPNFLCTNYELKFDHSATDADGDSLVYELFRPYDAASTSQPRPDNNGNGTLSGPPFPVINYAGSYYDQVPIDGSPPLDINRETGLLTLTPTVAGQFVVGIQVSEYRKGVLISVTRRDYQFNVDLCVIDVVASYYSPNFVCGFTYKFSNRSVGATRYHWDFGFSGSGDTSNQVTPTVTFPGPGKYRVSLIAYKNNCLDSFVQMVTVVAPSKPKLPLDSTICQGQNITYTSNLSGDKYLWSNGSNSNSITVSQPGMYWLEVTINTCAWRDTVILSVDTDKVKAIGDTLYCSDQGFTRIISALPGMKSYQWSTGESTRSISVTKSGSYEVIGTTIHNCISKDTVFIRRFSAVVVTLADTTVCPNTSATLNALNYDAKKLWNTGDTSSVVKVSAPGVYTVKVTRGLCSETASMTLGWYPNEFELGKNLRFCNAIDTMLNIANPKFSNIVWNGEVQGPDFHLSDFGMVGVNLLNQYGCPESDSILVQLFPNPALKLGADTTVCLAINPVLDAGFGMRSYKWMDNSDERFKVAYDTGLYWVEIMDAEGCKSRDSLFIHKDANLFPSLIYMPTAFTPDGNGRNDLYPDNKYKGIGTPYNVRLYNRWGEKIGDYDSPELNWDGTIKGNPAPEGVYVFVVNWIGCDNQIHSLRGTFHLLR